MLKTKMENGKTTAKEICLVFVFVFVYLLANEQKKGSNSFTNGLLMTTFISSSSQTFYFRFYI